MPKRNAAIGPMSLQPMEHGSIAPTQSQPMMPTTGKKPNTAFPKKQSARTEAVRIAKARIMRRNSLRKQRRAQKV
jgi:hypothetical protein